MMVGTEPFAKSLKRIPIVLVVSHFQVMSLPGNVTSTVEKRRAGCAGKTLEGYIPHAAIAITRSGC